MYLVIFHCELYCDIFRLLSKAIFRHIQNTRRNNAYVKHNNFFHVTDKLMLHYCHVVRVKTRIKTLKLCSLKFIEILYSTLFFKDRVFCNVWASRGEIS